MTKRTSRACESCRRRKIKCSGGSQCVNCLKFQETCNYRQHYRAIKGNNIIKIFKKPVSPGSTSPSHSTSRTMSDPALSVSSSPSASSSSSSSSSCLTTNETTGREKKNSFSEIVFTPPMLSNGKLLYDSSPPSPPSVTQSPSAAGPPPQFYEKDLFYTSLYWASPSHNYLCTCTKANKHRRIEFHEIKDIVKDYFNTYQQAYPIFEEQKFMEITNDAISAMQSNTLSKFNQIQLSLIYLVIALVTSSNEYYQKSRNIIPDLFQFEKSLNILQFAFLTSLYEFKVNKDFKAANELAVHALEKARSFNYDTSFDKYGNLPGLNSLESYRTFVSVYIWSLELVLVEQKDIPPKVLPVINPQTTINSAAFKNLTADVSRLQSRLSILEGYSPSLLSIALDSSSLILHYYCTLRYQHISQKDYENTTKLVNLIILQLTSPTGVSLNSPLSAFYKSLLDQCNLWLLYSLTIPGVAADTIRSSLESSLSCLVCDACRPSVSVREDSTSNFLSQVYTLQRREDGLASMVSHLPPGTPGLPSSSLRLSPPLTMSSSPRGSVSLPTLSRSHLHAHSTAPPLQHVQSYDTSRESDSNVNRRLPSIFQISPRSSVCLPRPRFISQQDSVQSLPSTTEKIVNVMEAEKPGVGGRVMKMYI